MTCSVEMAGQRGVIALDEDHVIMALDYAAASKDITASGRLLHFILLPALRETVRPKQ
jgi:hypothetical protein